MVGSLMDRAGKGIERRRKPAHVVTLVTESLQEVVHRWNHLHTAGQQRIVTGTTEITDGDALLTVWLSA